MACFVSKPSRITLVELSTINTSYQKLPFGNPSFRSWSGRKNKTLVQNRNRLLVRISCSGDSFFCSCASADRFLDRKFKPTSTTATSGAAPSALRSALDSSIQAYAQTLDWPRRDVSRRFTWYFFQQSIRAQHESCCSVCTLA